MKCKKRIIHGTETVCTLKTMLSQSTRKTQANINVDDGGHSNCETACPRCNGEHNNMFLQVIQKNVKRALVDNFIQSGECSPTPMQFCRKMQEIKKTTICFYPIRKTRKTCCYITSKD